jgi:uncharacterized Zn finger protein (UPF0148 family)
VCYINCALAIKSRDIESYSLRNNQAVTPPYVYICIIAKGYVTDLAKGRYVCSVASIKKKFASSKYSTMASSSEDNVSRIKTGASLLANGGTLTSVPCPKCSGVQVRLGEKITCINCGNEVNTAAAAAAGSHPNAERDKAAPARASSVLTSAASLIEEKIALIASEIRAENDISMQRQKAELLEKYLTILEKTKSLIG